MYPGLGPSNLLFRVPEDLVCPENGKLVCPLLIITPRGHIIKR